jgi:hypothetical protein
MALLYEERTARAEHACAWECGVPIKAGERYTASSLTPNDLDIGNTGWRHHALHGRSLYDCPPYRRASGEVAPC